MSTSLDALAIRSRLGRNDWWAPQPFGIDGWRFLHKERTHDGVDSAARLEIIVTVSDHIDGNEWIHASVATPAAPMPTYDDLVSMHRAVFNNAYQQFVPVSSHVNIHPYALHLWGRLDGTPAMPDFGSLLGSI
jgi:hypothetical protein